MLVVSIDGVVVCPAVDVEQAFVTVVHCPLNAFKRHCTSADGLVTLSVRHVAIVPAVLILRLIRATLQAGMAVMTSIGFKEEIFLHAAGNCGQLTEVGTQAPGEVGETDGPGVVVGSYLSIH